ncbi:MAG: hypothetical protein IKP88_12510 [Lachnospiraceae bacterium]|nr:hypothetical protein [Lachnospiraceae bacterium]
MKKIFKKLILVLVISLVLPIFFQGTVEVQAASKKTVRVATEKQLKTALKNLKVGTIVLRTGTYNTITIKSSKAQNKKIIIDAPNAIITNTAKFKTVEIIDAKKYIEAVSGNSLKISVSGVLEVAEGFKVKKLVMTNVPIEYTVHKNASIKNIIIADKNHKSTFDKKTRILFFETVGEWTSYSLDYYGNEEDLITQEYPIYYAAVLDKSGRTILVSYTGWACDYKYEYKYNDDGKCVELKQYNEETGILEQTSYYEYDNSGNCVEEKMEHSYEPYSYAIEYTYDKKGRIEKSVNSGKYYVENTEYSYDDKNRLTSTDTTTVWFEGDSISSRKSWSISYIYDKNGFLQTKELLYPDEYFSYLYNYEYDKYGNMIHETEIYTNKGYETITEKRYEYDDLGVRVNEG